MRKKLLTCLLTVGLILANAVLGFGAEEDLEQIAGVQEVFLGEYSSLDVYGGDPRYLYGNEDQVDILRDGMLNKEPAVTVVLTSDEAPSNEVFTSMYTALLDAAFEVNDNPRMGDYLRFHIAEIGVGLSQRGSTYQFTFYLDYYTTLSQEEQVTARVDQVIQELGVREMESDFDKIKAVYDYITSTVTYDYENLEDDSYGLKYTAYAALFDHTAVCQGYTLLFYRFMKELGIPVKCIEGQSHNQNHIWNIVMLDGIYYNVDATWDSGRKNYQYFLKSESTFAVDHTRRDASAEPFMYTKYPVSETDYTNNGMDITAEGEWGNNITWTYYQDNSLVFRGSGDIAEFSEDNYPWTMYYKKARTVIFEEGITSLPLYILGNFTDLQEVVIPSTMKSIHFLAFAEAIVKEFTISPDNQQIALIDGNLYDLSQGLLVYCCDTDLGELVIPEQITSFFEVYLSLLASVDTIHVHKNVEEYLLTGWDHTVDVYFYGPAIEYFGDTGSSSFHRLYYPINEKNWYWWVSPYTEGDDYIWIPWEPATGEIYYDKAPHEHKFVSYENESTCQEEGIRYNQCEICGQKSDEEVLPKANHTYKDHICTSCGATEPVSAPVLTKTDELIELMIPENYETVARGLLFAPDGDAPVTMDTPGRICIRFADKSPDTRYEYHSGIFSGMQVRGFAIIIDEDGNEIISYS